jgi:hypothetical protein
MRVFYLCPENWLKRRVGAGVNKRLRADMHSSLANPEEDFDGTKVGLLRLTSHRTAKLRKATLSR